MQAPHEDQEKGRVMTQAPQTTEGESQFSQSQPHVLAWTTLAIGPFLREKGGGAGIANQPLPNSLQQMPSVPMPEEQQQLFYWLPFKMNKLKLYIFQFTMHKELSRFDC